MSESISASEKAETVPPGEEAVRAAFRLQATYCAATGSPLTALIVGTLADTLDRSTRTGARILDWPGDPMIDALKLRIAGGLNALARRGDDAGLSALYRDGAGDAASILRRVLAEHDDWLHEWLDSAPQTNEVGRAAVLWPGIMAASARFGPRIELLELGASGGLNLNMDRFGYDLGGVVAGDPASAVQLHPVWSGAPPVAAPVEVIDRAAVDLNPLDMTQPEVANRMLAYIWPDQGDRVARAEAAIAIARAFPPPVEPGDGADWIEARLAMPQQPGVTRLVYHSIALQYFPPEDRERVRLALAAAGACATPDRPLAWLSMEFHDQVTLAELRLTCWPGDGHHQLLARCHPHGARVEWLGGDPG